MENNVIFFNSKINNKIIIRLGVCVCLLVHYTFFIDPITPFKANFNDKVIFLKPRGIIRILKLELRDSIQFVNKKSKYTIC